jgi:hypothetical protein
MGDEGYRPRSFLEVAGWIAGGVLLVLLFLWGTGWGVAETGQLGDTFNVFALVALGAALYSIHLQQGELTITREILQAERRAQEQLAAAQILAQRETAKQSIREAHARLLGVLGAGLKRMLDVKPPRLAAGGRGLAASLATMVGDPRRDALEPVVHEVIRETMAAEFAVTLVDGDPLRCRRARELAAKVRHLAHGLLSAVSDSEIKDAEGAAIVAVAEILATCEELSESLVTHSPVTAEQPPR